MISDHPTLTAAAAPPPERRRRPFIVDLVVAPNDRPCHVSEEGRLRFCDHYVGDRLDVADAVAWAKADHPGSRLLGIREVRP